MEKKELSMIVGRLGKNPVLYMRNTKKGRLPVAKFSVAVNTLTNGEMKTTWVQASAWQKRSEVVMKYLRKGDPVQLHGFLGKEVYTNRKGETIEGLAFDAVFITLLGKARSNEDKVNTTQQEVAQAVGECDVPEYAAYGVPPEEDIPF